MHAVGSLAWRILFSLTFMSHLYKEFSCESKVHNTDNGLEQNIAENQMQNMRTEYTEQKILNRLGLHQTPRPKVLIPGQETNAGKFGIVGDDGPEIKLPSMTAMLQMKKEEFLRDMISARKRRHSSGQKEAIEKCQRHELYVNFTTLGWNSWLVAPVAYNAFYCAGECKINLVDLQSTKHATIQGLISATNPNIPKPCCVPTKLSAINAVTNINSTVNVETWTDMVVDECGCL